MPHHIVLDKEGIVVATYNGQGPCSVEPPPNGEVVCVHAEHFEQVNQLMESGKRVKYASGFVLEIERPLKARARAMKDVKEVRRDKLKAIADEITKARDRGFAEEDKYVAAKGLELARQIDVMWQVLQGKLKDADTVWMRNWWTGDQEKITVAQWKVAMDEIFPLRQDLRKVEQIHRDKVAVIFNNDKLTDREKAEQIDAVVVPEFLDLEEDSTKDVIASKAKREVVADGK